MNSLNWIDFLLAAGLVQGLFLAFLLPHKMPAQKASNLILSVLLVVASVTILLFINLRTQSQIPPQSYILMDTTAFLYGPLLYLYLKKLLFPTDPDSFWQVVHFLPFLLHFAYFLGAFRYTSTTFITLVWSGAFRPEWAVILTFLVSLLVMYWVASLRLVLRFKRQEKKVLSFQHNLRYVSIFLGAAAASYVIGLIFTLDFLFGIQIFSFTDTYLGWVMIPFLIYFISYFAIRQPEGLYITYKEEEYFPLEETPSVSTISIEKTDTKVEESPIEEKKSLARLTTDQMRLYVHHLEEFMRQDKPYLNPTLSLQDLAQQLQLHSTKLSWLINEHYQCNFYDYVNMYRLEEFLEKIQARHHEKHTLLAIAYDVGFNSKTTFNKSFKKAMQCTPSEYVQKINITKSVA